MIVSKRDLLCTSEMVFAVFDILLLTFVKP